VTVAPSSCLAVRRDEGWTGALRRLLMLSSIGTGSAAILYIARHIGLVLAVLALFATGLTPSAQAMSAAPAEMSDAMMDMTEMDMGQPCPEQAAAGDTEPPCHDDTQNGNRPCCAGGAVLALPARLSSPHRVPAARRSALFAADRVPAGLIDQPDQPPKV
jgi:hypothetical protein